MGAPQRPMVGVPAVTPGLGLGWTRIADALAKVVSPPDIRRIWIFSPMRRDGREWGTAVIATTAEGCRLVVFTAKYMINTRGKRQGQGRVEIAEVGEGPTDVVPDVVHGVHDRVSEGEPAIEIAPDLWFAQEHDQPAA
ncbi:MAG: hypothetical protein IID05_04940 [Gemmatimonadetes bacterium]|nr:hypothetical protein [Gemmatimonadota bacterium]MCH7490024.1 hypothetical protein [Gemmatimonadota bacterium]MCH7715956.1 hypothetical protein [Gemmatimonadota bacterium]MCH8993180.1 hypothetical protein [Acidobacteriota bacterium]